MLHEAYTTEKTANSFPVISVSVSHLKSLRVLEPESIPSKSSNSEVAFSITENNQIYPLSSSYNGLQSSLPYYFKLFWKLAGR